MPSLRKCLPGEYLYKTKDKAKSVFAFVKQVSLEYPGKVSDTVNEYDLESLEFFGMEHVLKKYRQNKPAERDEDAKVESHCTILEFPVVEFEDILLSNFKVTMKIINTLVYKLLHIESRIAEKKNGQAYLDYKDELFKIGEMYKRDKRYFHAKHIFTRYRDIYGEDAKSDKIHEYLQELESIDKSENKYLYGNISQAEPSLDVDKLTGKKREFEPEDIIVSQHEPGTSFFYLHSGKVDIRQKTGDTDESIRELSSGTLFGEIAFFNRSPRTASVLAMSKVVAYEYHGGNFQDLLNENGKRYTLELLGALSLWVCDAKDRLQEVL